MDNKEKISNLKDICHNFCVQRDWEKFHIPKDLSIGISTEAAELLDLFRFKSDIDISNMLNDLDKKEKISEELSDILFFVLRFSKVCDIDLSSNLLKKIKKNEEKYPVEKVKGLNKKYNEY